MIKLRDILFEDDKSELISMIQLVLEWTDDPNFINKREFVNISKKFPNDWKSSKDVVLYRGFDSVELADEIRDTGSIILEDRIFSSWTSDKAYAMQRAEAGGGFVLKCKIKSVDILCNVNAMIQTITPNMKKKYFDYGEEMDVVEMAGLRDEYIVLDKNYRVVKSDMVTYTED